jgi:fibro-slime domain-containing protein
MHQLRVARLSRLPSSGWLQPHFSIAPACLLALLAAACGNNGGGSGGPDGGGSGSGSGSGDGGVGSDANDPRCGTLRAKLRDFKIEHPDFEADISGGAGLVQGIVSSTIVPGGKPTLSPTRPAGGFVTSDATFAQWYTDVPGVNLTVAQDLALTEETPGIFVYDNAAFFPLDNLGWGNEGNAHNFHFTSELHASFAYKGGERFTFRGDDDVWVYVNGKLAIDIGGVHGAREETIDFDAQAAALGMRVGYTYPIDFFQAERHTTESNFRIATSIDCFIVE